MKTRRITEEDWDILPIWWDKWPKWTTPSRDALPDNGLGGLMVELNGLPLMCGFIYKTNSKGVWFEWIISDPEYKDRDQRQKALELLIGDAEKLCISEGFKYILFIGKHKNLINTFKNMGWHVDSEPSYELIKKIN
tara:strand:- start:11494 stop:11901 length:408 start_codon:yes stop_codon:yes gene_type:complete